MKNNCEILIGMIRQNINEGLASAKSIVNENMYILGSVIVFAIIVAVFVYIGKGIIQKIKERRERAKFLASFDIFELLENLNAKNKSVEEKKPEISLLSLKSLEHAI